MNEQDKKLRAVNIFNKNVEKLNWATHVVAVIDNYDTGTVWEMGYAFRGDIKIISFSSYRREINIMLRESITAHCFFPEQIILALLGEYNEKYIGDII